MKLPAKNWCAISRKQDIFFADVPVMADLYEENGRFKLGNLGTFLINGVDRVIVSQLHRSPGVVFSQSKKAKMFVANRTIWLVVSNARIMDRF